MRPPWRNWSGSTPVRFPALPPLASFKFLRAGMVGSFERGLVRLCVFEDLLTKRFCSLQREVAYCIAKVRAYLPF